MSETQSLLQTSRTALAANTTNPERRQQLIDATIRVIAKHGLSNTTTARVAQEAGLSNGIVNFYFTSKDQLFLATLSHLSTQFMGVLENAIAASGTDPGENLQALIAALFDPRVSAPESVAVWYAFWGEAAARADYLRACGGKDEAYHRAVEALIAQLAEAAPESHPVSVAAVTSGLTGLLDEAWQTILVEQQNFDRKAAIALANDYIASVFPWRFQLKRRSEDKSQGAEIVELPLTLPAWTYGNNEFFNLERDKLFRRAWQVVGHISEIPKAGDYMTFELLGERAFVVRGKDGEVRAFHNVCRHRAHAVVSGESGHCAGVIRCHYHGWLYNLDGRLRAMIAEKSFQGADKADFGLKPLEMEIFLGFVFIRFESGEPSVAERLAPYADEMALYRTAEMQPLSDLWKQEIAVDWKNVLDNYLEGYHVPASHPGLYDLFGARYDVEARSGGVGRAIHWVRDEAAQGWSQRAYQRLLPAQEHLPDNLKRAWSYYSLFPSMLFDFYADSIDYFQVLPLDAGRTLLRGRRYALPGASRELKAAQYLNLRINTEVQREDNALTESVQAGLGSSAYSVGILSEKEAVLRAFHDWVRQRLPVAKNLSPPKEGTVALMNEGR